MPPKIAVYPGSFDPITNGHLDIIERSLQVFDRVIVAVATNSSKKSLFTLKERTDLVTEVLKHEPRVTVHSFEGLLVDYVVEQGADVIIRGLRAVSDFEFEFQLALMNSSLAPKIQTLFMMTSASNSFLSSTIIKEVSALKGTVDGMVPPQVKAALDAKFHKGN